MNERRGDYQERNVKLHPRFVLPEARRRVLRMLRGRNSGLFTAPDTVLPPSHPSSGRCRNDLLPVANRR